MTRISTAVIGAGRWGRNLIRNVQQSRDLQLSVVADIDLEALSRIDAAVSVTDSAEGVFSDRHIRAVVIATPPASHFRLAKEALLFGKHVLCEKPLALNSEECRELRTLAADSKLCLMIDCTPVYLDEVQKAKHEIDWRGVRRIRCLRTSSRAPEDPIQLLWDLAPHDLAVLHFWLEDLPDEWEIADDAAELVKLHSEPDSGPRLEIICGRSPTPAREIAILSDAGTRRLRQQQSDPEPLQVVVSHFAECIRRGTPPLTGAECAIQTARVISGATSCIVSTS